VRTAVPFDLASHIILSVVALADGAHDVLFFADGPVRDAPPNRALHVPHLALRFDHWRRGFRVPQGVCVLDSVLIRLDLREQGQEARCVLPDYGHSELSDSPIPYFRIAELLAKKSSFGCRIAHCTEQGFDKMIRCEWREGRTEEPLHSSGQDIHPTDWND